MMAITSSKINDLLLCALDELSQENFKRFKDKLSFIDFDGEGNIPQGPLENADRIDTKNLLVKFYGEDTVLDVAIEVFTQINLRDSAVKLKEEKRKALDPNPKSFGIAANDYRMTYSEHIQEEYQSIEDRNARLGECVSLNRRYTQLLIVKEHRHWEAKQHEIMATGKRHAEILAKTATPTKIESLFDIDKRRPTPRTIVLQGAAGIGKTMTVRKIMLDWASEKIYPGRFDYVFYISCREMNLSTKQISVADLILNNCPDKNAPIKDILMDPEKLLFIIDGFDELKFSFDQQITNLYTDPCEKQPVEIILGSLFRKKVLPKSFLLITTRPTALEKLQNCLKFPHYAEILGFSEEDREEYFHKFFEDKKQAAKAFGFVIENEILFTMCFVPIVCWIICTVIKQQIEKGEDLTQTSKTTTAVYMLFLSSLLRDHSCMSKHSRQTNLRKLCSLAREGVWRKIILFEEDDLKKHGLDVSNIQSLFLNKSIFQKDIDCEHAYSFIHLSFQEFFAALFYVLEEEEETVEESVTVTKDVSKLLQSYEEPKNDYLMLTVRFLFGLLNMDRMKEIEKCLGCKTSLDTKSKVLNWVEEVGIALASLSSKDRNENKFKFELFHFLFEIQEEEIVTRAMDCFPRIHLELTCFSKMKFTVLSFCLKNCQRMQSLFLCSCSGGVSFLVAITSSRKVSEIMALTSEPPYMVFYKDMIQMGLQPGIPAQGNPTSRHSHANQPLTHLDEDEKACQSNLIKKELVEGLKHPNCKVQKLGLRNCCISNSDCKQLASVLSTNQNLKELDLRGNNQGDAGVKLLCEGLKHPDCKLQKLVLSYCMLTAACCQGLSCVLSTNQTLRELDLEINKLGYSGVQQLCEGLRHATCKLEILRLGHCGIIFYDCKYLALVLSTNQTLKELDLSGSKLGDLGVKQLCEGLKHPDCKLQKLMLGDCGIAASGCKYFASVLSTNQTLKELDLKGSKLGDLGVKQLCEGLKHPDCKLQKLVLGDCGIAASGCKYFASVLSTNQTLKELDLKGSKLGDLGVKQLCEGLKHPDCKLQKLVLSYCTLTAGCCGDLSSVLSTNQTLRELDLERNELGDSVLLVGYSGMQQLCEGLKDKTCKLEILRLGYCGIMASDCKYLASVLSTNQTLKELDLGGNKQANSGVKLLCEGLKHPDCKLQRLVLRSCYFKDACMRDLSLALSINHSLNELDLQFNLLSFPFVTHLYKELKCRRSNLKIIM
ncbi:NACHT, LRR and PYD domains-containing protein 3-like [Mauremys reevesii]|uniref:NACHT, LRR and PYD domains-containing protein 3-like n=1 Tax=Mauremys reevesii TaxID=260615 RepID=UPI0019401433|nr:NACHT, LRR and PYD domains-containing protein 3-like [Mauremys reevesii]